MKILASIFILLTLLSACEQRNMSTSMGRPMGMEGHEMNEGSEFGERH